MTLTAAEIERYSRQIVLPEVGGRGQARLLAGRVKIAGTDSVARTAASLLARAGVGAVEVTGENGPPAADAIVDLSGDPAIRVALGRRAQAAGTPFVLGTLAGSRVVVATLVGRPCIACLPPAESKASVASSPVGAPAALALAALAATEALRVLLFSADHGRSTVLDLAAGTASARELVSTGSCTLCGASA